MPFLPLNKYIPDGEPHIFGDRIYLFGSHEEAGGDTYCTLDYEFFSAVLDDLSNWSSKGINYSAKQDALYSKERSYYFIYSSQLNHELCYATSKYPDRDFKYGGTIVSAGDVGLNGRKQSDTLNTIGTTHGSIECINGQWYVFYHRLTHASDYSRQACAEPIKIQPDDSIRQVEVTSCGLNNKPLIAKGKYPAAIACNITNGKMPKISNKKYDKPIPMVMQKGDESLVANIDNKTVVAFKWFDFEKNLGTINLDIDSNADGEIEIFASNELLSRQHITPYGRLIVPFSYRITNKTKQTLSIKFSGKGKFNLYSLDFV